MIPLVIVMLVLALGFGVLGQDDVELQLNTPINKAALNAGAVRYYSFRAPSNLASNYNYLIFDLSAAGEEVSDPDIFISTVICFLRSLAKSASNP